MFYISIIFILFVSFFIDNFLYFYLAFEFSVIPIFFYIIVWGNSEDKVLAGLYLFFYTYISSLIFFVRLFNMWVFAKRFNFNLLFFMG